MGNTRLEFENKYYEDGFDYILGLDEAGRGPMAGEIVVAGVVFNKGYYNVDINDSKALSHKKRLELYDIIIENAYSYHIEIISVGDVDRLNVYQASKAGMLICYDKLKKDNMFVLTDAMPLSDEIDHLSIIKGDSLSMSIAAASILAKVTRDNLMIEYSNEYPGYGFDKHKGYCTKMHKQAILDNGITPIHRKTFKPVMDLMKDINCD